MTRLGCYFLLTCPEHRAAWVVSAYRSLSSAYIGTYALPPITGRKRNPRFLHTPGALVALVGLGDCPRESMLSVAYHVLLLGSYACVCPLSGNVHLAVFTSCPLQAAPRITACLSSKIMRPLPPPAAMPDLKHQSINCALAHDIFCPVYSPNVGVSIL